jgi:AraC family transcriptional regulator
MKKTTLLNHSKMANDALYYIYKYIDTDINIEELADDLKVSRFHLQRVFKDVFGKNIYESIKQIRLHKAANLLITNKHSTISEITSVCGYASQSSFNKVFRDRFGMSPKEWRRDGYRKYSADIISTSDWAMNSEMTFENLKPKMVRMPKMTCVYIRHNGYGRTIKRTWEKLYMWALKMNAENSMQIGLHHDNPSFTPLSECSYIACLSIDGMKEGVETELPQTTIPGGIFARFDLQGRYGDVLKFMQWVYNDWFPANGYETTTLPAYAVYEKNHFLSDDDLFVLSYYIPVTYSL